jgi:hypothetical protein
VLCVVAGGQKQRRAERKVQKKVRLATAKSSHVPIAHQLKRFYDVLEYGICSPAESRIELRWLVCVTVSLAHSTVEIPKSAAKANHASITTTSSSSEPSRDIQCGGESTKAARSDENG